MKSLLSVMQIQQFNHLHLEQPMYYVQDRILCKLSSQTQTYIELKTDLCKNTTSSTLVKLNMWDMYVYCFFLSLLTFLWYQFIFILFNVFSL